jgi:hypothetical protein
MVQVYRNKHDSFKTVFPLIEDEQMYDGVLTVVLEYDDLKLDPVKPYSLKKPHERGPFTRMMIDSIDQDRMGCSFKLLRNNAEFTNHLRQYIRDKSYDIKSQEKIIKYFESE